MSHESFQSGDDDAAVAVLDREPIGATDATDLVVPALAVRNPRSVSRPASSHARSADGCAIPDRFRDRFPHGVSWPVTLWMFTMHAGAVAALFYFTPAGLALFLGLHFVTACFGITLGYHRLLTHGSLIVPQPLKYFFSLCGMLSAEGSPLMWVATHRKHHVHSDGEEDPHSPRHGFWWSHMLWFYPAETKAEMHELFTRWAPDMYKDPVQRFFHRTFMIYPLLLGIALYSAGQYFLGQGLSWVLWGLCFRMVVAYHSTWFVNSATHLWGYRNYETTDRSRNLWWVALVSYGEGWHNNHHAHQRLAVHGHRWWEVDVTYMVIRLLKATGLATKVQDRLPEGGEKA
ncbi:MAG: acyl-CoA desaturase [Planctomycetaceae bacterium]